MPEVYDKERRTIIDGATDLEPCFASIVFFELRNFSEGGGEGGCLLS